MDPESGLRQEERMKGRMDGWMGESLTERIDEYRVGSGKIRRMVMEGRMWGEMADRGSNTEQ